MSPEERDAQRAQLAQEAAEQARVKTLPLNQGGWRQVGNEEAIVKRCDGPHGVYTLWADGISVVPNDEECKPA